MNESAYVEMVVVVVVGWSAFCCVSVLGGVCVLWVCCVCVFCGVCCVWCLRCCGLCCFVCVYFVCCVSLCESVGLCNGYLVNWPSGLRRQFKALV